MSAGDIIAAFTSEASASIPKAKVLEWMKETDICARGALYTFLTHDELATRVQPPLDLSEHPEFVLEYLAACIVQNPQDELTDSRYLAAHALCAWFNYWWADADTSHKLAKRAKDRITDLYETGTHEIRDAIITGLLEHLFENVAIERFFADWNTSTTLASAYQEAISLVRR
jgi:hypothetical protein